MNDITARAAPPPPSSTEKLKFYGLWIATGIFLLVLPKVFGSGGSLTTFSLIGISIIFALSYNILLGQTGMLSFGHAVYYGLGGFLVIHAINIIGGNKWPIPLPFVPIIGGLTGLAFAILLGWVSTQRSGTAFAMISLGVAELVASSALILRTFFGGEAGISANRTKLLKFFDWNFGPQIQIYYLVAAWTLICMIGCMPSRVPRSGACAMRSATTPNACSSWATIRMWCAISRSASPASSPASRARWPPSTSRSRTRPISARCSPARCCSRPISAASASSSDRWSARSSSPSCRWA
jgi:branched-chain amino acid transport system permease protein